MQPGNAIPTLWEYEMRYPSIIVATLLLLAPHQPAFAEAGGKLGRSEATESAAPASRFVNARPAMWVVRDHDTTIYLFGTIHLLKPQIRWFEGPIRKAFNRADEVVLEVADRDKTASQAEMFQTAFQPNGETTSSKLPEEVQARFLAALEQNGVPAAVFDRMQPWFSALTLAILPLQKHGYDPTRGADHVIEQEALAKKKKLTGLETSSQQMGFFSGMPEALQLSLLTETLNELPSLTETIEKMIVAWSAGEPEALALLLNESVDSNHELRQRLLTDRNANWADWISTRLARPGTVFMAVGAGHLAGKDSVQDMLAARGLNAVLMNPAP